MDTGIPLFFPEIQYLLLETIPLEIIMRVIGSYLFLSRPGLLFFCPPLLLPFPPFLPSGFFLRVLLLPAALLLLLGAPTPTNQRHTSGDVKGGSGVGGHGGGRALGVDSLKLRNWPVVICNHNHQVLLGLERRVERIFSEFYTIHAIWSLRVWSLRVSTGSLKK